MRIVDSPPPPGWNAPEFVGGTVSIDSAVGDLRVEIYRTSALADGRVRVYVNVIDAGGRVVTGIGSADQWRAWCSVIDSSASGVQELTFTVHEKTITDTVPIALVLALDHSGSMGEERTRKLQQAANELLQLKRGIDAVGVVKFDESSNLERALTIDTSGLPIVGARGFGGETAMFDAARMAVEHAVRARQNRSAAGVVLLTDGDDNASKTTPRELLDLARASAVPVFTVRFGPWLACPSSRALDEISDQTGARSYHVFSREDFAPVFADVLRRMTAHYVVEYRSADSGWHRVSLLGCGRRDSALASARIHLRRDLSDLAVTALPPVVFVDPRRNNDQGSLLSSIPVVTPELEIELLRRASVGDRSGTLYRVTLRDPGGPLDSLAMFFPLSEFIRHDMVGSDGSRDEAALLRALDRLQMVLESHSDRSFSLLVQGHADIGFGPGRDHVMYRTVRGMPVSDYVELEPQARDLLGRQYAALVNRGDQLQFDDELVRFTGPGYNNRELAFLRGAYVRDLIRSSGRLRDLPMHLVDGAVDQVRDPRRRTCSLYLFEADVAQPLVSTHAR